MQLVRVTSALLLVVIATTTAAAAAAPPLPAASTRRAHVFLPEQPRREHQLLLAALEALGVEQFEPPAAEQEALARWAQLPGASDDVDLVWSFAASPPYSELSFPSAFRPKLNHLPGAERLTSTDRLAAHVRQGQRQHGRYYFNFVPDRFVLPRDHERMAQAFPAAAKKVELELKRERDPYIYQRFLVREQPVSTDESAQTTADVIIGDKELAAKLAGPLAGKQVEVSSYIEPYLLDGHKFTVGFYVAVTSIDPLRVYAFSHASVKIAKVAYPQYVDSSSDRGAYNFDEFVPPWDFPELQREFLELPSAEREGSNAWAIVKRYLMMKGLDTRRLQREIDDAIMRAIVSSRGHFQSEIGKLKRSQRSADADAEPVDLADKFFDLWKFDFELDDMGKPWLTKVSSNPSLAPEHSVFGTDEAIKKRMLFDLVNMVGVHPQAKQPFDSFFRPSDAAFCAHKCADRTRVWDSACWSCAGWFPPPVARRLFESVAEYARRGRFQLLFPDLEKDHSKFLDTSLSDHDLAFDRYLKSLSSGYAEHPESPLSTDRKVLCVYREHCSGNGDCVNGECRCDAAYEGLTCYLPRDPSARTNELVAPAHAAQATLGEQDGAQASGTWKEKVGKLWNGAPAAPAEDADAEAPGSNAGASGEAAPFAPAKLLIGLLLLAAFVVAGRRVWSAFVSPTHARKSK
ncbi:hypothetical protein PybrP1_001707 [[Pythium] brassicae (nom. inval.)]|nr:hypothetical protein PybrP1_001707 [[Pythium] brassicae (nom. inval.)]